MNKRHIVAFLHKKRCDQAVLVPALDKLEERELRALWGLFQNIQRDAISAGKRKGAREPRRYGRQ